MYHADSLVEGVFRLDSPDNTFNLYHISACNSLPPEKWDTDICIGFYIRKILPNTYILVFNKTKVEYLNKSLGTSITIKAKQIKYLFIRNTIAFVRPFVSIFFLYARM